MSKQSIKENEFSGAPGGTAGTVNYQTGYGTHASPEVSQNPANFASSNSNTVKDVPDSGSMAKDVNAIYAKKDTPTPDEIVSGIKYEMGQQIKKDKLKAKEEVLKNLKRDPHYYRDLKMLNIDDKSMVDNMTETKQHPNDRPAQPKVITNTSETKKIFAEMSKAKEKKYVVNANLVDVMEKMWAEKKQRNSWRGL